MPDYTVVSPDGRELHLVGDKPPTIEQVKGLFAHLAKQKEAKPTTGNHDTPKAAKATPALSQRQQPAPKSSTTSLKDQVTAQIQERLQSAQAERKRVASEHAQAGLRLDEASRKLGRGDIMGALHSIRLEDVNPLTAIGDTVHSVAQPIQQGLGMLLHKMSGGPTIGPDGRIKEQKTSPHTAEWDRQTARLPLGQQMQAQDPRGFIQNINPDAQARLDAKSKNKGVEFVKGIARGAEGVATVDNLMLGYLLGPGAIKGPLSHIVHAAVSGYFTKEATDAYLTSAEKFQKSGGKDTGAAGEGVVSLLFTGLSAYHGLNEAGEIRAKAMKTDNPIAYMTQRLEKDVAKGKPSAQSDRPLPKPIFPKKPIPEPVKPAEPPKAEPPIVNGHKAQVARRAAARRQDPVVKAPVKTVETPKPETSPNVPPVETKANETPGPKSLLDFPNFDESRRLAESLSNRNTPKPIPVDVELSHATTPETVKPATEPPKGTKPPEPAPAVDPEPGTFTGARNSVVEPERAMRNLPEVDRQVYKTVGNAFLLGKDAVERGTDHHALAREVAANPRTLSIEEVGTLAYGRHLIKQRYDSLGAQMDAAIASGDKAAIARLRPEIEEAESQYDANDNALVKGGREQSAAFSARKLIITDEGNALDLQRAGKRRAGRELSTIENAKFEKLAKEHQQANAEIERLTGENSKMDAEKAVQKLVEISTQEKRAGRLKDLHVERKALTDALTDYVKKPRLSAGPGLAVEVSITLGKLAVNYIKGGLISLEDVVEKIQADFPEFSDRHIHDALSGYGRPAPKGMDATQKKIAELKKEAKLISQTEDEPAVDTRVPKEPSETDNPHIISMRDELSEHRKQRTRREEIADLEAYIEANHIQRKGVAKDHPKSEDEVRLAELKKKYAEMQTNLDAADNLRDLIEHERNGIETRQKPGDPRVQSEEEQNLRNELNQYRKQRDTKKAIDALQEKLDKGDIEEKGVPKDRPRTADTEKLAELKREYAKRQEDLVRLDKLRNDIELEKQGVDTRTPKEPTREPLPGETELRQERDTLRNEKDATRKSEEVQRKLNLSEIDPKKPLKAKAANAARLAELQAEYRKRQAELERIPNLEKKLAIEEAGGVKKPARVPGEEEAALKKQIATERRIRELNEQAAKLEKEHAAGILKEPVKVEPGEADPRLKAAVARKTLIKGKITSELERLKPKTALDRVVSYGRAVKLAGLGVFGKLGGASFWAMPVETLANAMSVIPGKLRVKGVPLYQIAEREGQFKLGTEMKGYRAFASKEAVNNARDVFKQGFNQIHTEAQAQLHGGNELSSLPGRLHGVAKSFLQTAEYNKAFDYRMNRMAEQYAREGKNFDINDPEILGKVGYGAALDAQMEILQGPNALSTAIGNTITAIERSGNDKGPIATASAKLGAAFLKTLAPITKVPANYIGKTLQMTGLGIPEGMARQAAAHFSKEPLKPAEADNIIRAYKNGGLGLVAMTIGLTQPAFFRSAGFFPDYRKGTQPNKDKDGNPLRPSEFQVGNVKIPHQLAHNPFLEAIQFWATVRRGIEQQMPGKGAIEAARGMLSQAPGLESVTGAGQALVGDGYDPGGFWGDYTRGMVEPQIFNEMAKWGDKDAEGKPVDRKTTGFGGKIMAGIPGLRQKLPIKGAKGGDQEDPLLKKILPKLPDAPKVKKLKY